jgi:hypothetical protein
VIMASGRNYRKRLWAEIGNGGGGEKKRGLRAPFGRFYVWWRLIGGYVFRAGGRDVVHCHL